MCSLTNGKDSNLRLLLLAAFTGSRPQLLLCSTYCDLDVYLDKNVETDIDVLRLGVKLTKTKSRQSVNDRKSGPSPVVVDNVNSTRS